MGLKIVKIVDFIIRPDDMIPHNGIIHHSDVIILYININRSMNLLRCGSRGRRLYPSGGGNDRRMSHIDIGTSILQIHASCFTSPAKRNYMEKQKYYVF